MLSIGKVGMSAGQQLYYEEQVAKGAEDYYAGRGEAPGRWTGRGAGLLGLSGQLDAERLKAMMDGRHPVTGERLASRSGNVSTAAIDMTFSAPKSVSVLFAIGDTELSRALVEAHEEAVDAALAYIEDVACRVRRGHNGTVAEREAGDPRGWERARSEPAGGFVTAAYRHRMSRAQDPQLHTHCVSANMARGGDGRWTALDARHIYEHAKAGGSVYQAHLRQAVSERLSWAVWGPVHNGMAELEQVPAAVVQEFSTRRRRILERERELVAAGLVVGDAGRERIAFDTRETKQKVEDLDWRIEVRARAAEHGLGQAELDRLADLPSRSLPEAIGELDLAERLFSAGGLTATANTFAELDVVIAVAAAHGQGAPANEVVELARRLLERSEVVAIPDRSDRRYTTRELLGAERAIVTAAVNGQGQGVAVVGEVDVLMALSGAERLLSTEQERVVVGVAGSGNRIDTVEALAGTGKTTSAAALRAVYERAGYRVLGAAPTGRAVRELKEQAGIEESRTLDGWLAKLDSDPSALRRAPDDQNRARPTVMIVDEAGMAGTRVSARVLEAAVTADVKVVAFGDSGQLASVQAGGWLGAVTRKVGSFELREVMRQRDPQERRGLASVHRGEPEVYLERKMACGELALFAGEHAQSDAEHAAIERWAAAREAFGPEQAVLICRDNQRRERLNRAARARLAQLGELGEGVVIAGREWCVGERVIARRNDRGRDVDNGTRGTITDVDVRDGLRVRTDSGAVRQVDGEYASQHLEYAYALTGHGMQGGTVEWAAVIGRPGDFTRNWSYTALSRAREPTEILLVDEPTRAQADRAAIAPGADPTNTKAPLARMAARMRERDDESLALEQLDHRERVTEAPRPEKTASAAGSSELRARFYEVQRELRDLRPRLDDPRVKQAEALAKVSESIAGLEAERERDRKPQSRSDRPAHKHRLTTREHALTELREQERSLGEQVPDSSEVLKRDDEVRESHRLLLKEMRELRARTIDEELAEQPVWLTQTLGSEPSGRTDRDRWQRTARQIAGHRIEQHVTDPGTAINEQTADRALIRSISDTRAALGLEVPGSDQDRGLGI